MMDTAALSALSEPKRQQIVELLAEGPLTVGEIAETLCLRQPQTSKHLRVLLEAGIVNVRAEANRRSYSLRPEPFQAMDHWLNAFRNLWMERLDNLDHYLQQLQSKDKKQDR
ncbi:ArsR/SmtB family transcription factor [Paenibacillus lemnae]|uniref:Winged helix-turn-helix transcriptional regulator n=1 Tax=Paenibacillus lemnae TaxID=1330551 RepID=A0A848M3E5_PAELE|nr:metalloregulator ArsR/SmtB family transcription factor [Paenibacillus lemnae]NMO94363.1 winged helix-turn-helix transcriptional regulator [Paenibacillus lemnae]